MSNRKKRIGIVVFSGDRLLCNDGLYRLPAHFGTFPECVKFYKTEGWASRNFLKGANSLVFLYEGDEIDSSGRVTRKR